MKEETQHKASPFAREAVDQFKHIFATNHKWSAEYLFNNELVSCVQSAITTALNADRAEMEKVFRALVERLDFIHEDPAYRGVWTHFYVHGLRYNGPTYENELNACREVLQHSTRKGGDETCRTKSHNAVHSNNAATKVQPSGAAERAWNMVAAATYPPSHKDAFLAGHASLQQQHVEEVSTLSANLAYADEKITELQDFIRTQLLVKDEEIKRLTQELINIREDRHNLND